MKVRLLVPLAALCFGIGWAALALTYRLCGWTWGEPWIDSVAGATGVCVACLFMHAAYKRPGPTAPR